MSDSSQITPRKRNLLIAAAVAELVFKVIAARDIHGRSADQLRGPKAAWYAALVVNFVGPAAYFVFGRR